MRSVTSRFMVPLLSLALIAAGCAQPDEPETTPDASLENEIQISGSFEITGPVTDVETDETPDELDIERIPSASPQLTEGAALNEPGSLEVEVRTSDDKLATSCAIEAGDTIDVHWTTQTRFVPGTLVEGDDWDDELEDQEITVEGRYIEADPDVGLVDDRCTFVADVVRTGAGTGATSTPGAGASPSPTTSPTSSPTQSPGA